MERSATQKHHIVPLKIYIAIGLALYALTAVTVMVSFIQLGGWNVVVALAIAALKATLVALIFMHLLYDRKILLVVFITAILFLAIFIIFTMFDTITRGQINEETNAPIRKDAVIYDSLSNALEVNDKNTDSLKIGINEGH